MDEVQDNKALDDGLSEALLERIRKTTKEVGAPRNQLAEFMASSARMLDMQRRKIMDAESEYQFERIKLLDSYRVQIENLKHECAEAVRALDQKHRDDIADARTLFDKLTQMRSI